MEFPGVRPYIYIEGTGAASEGLLFQCSLWLSILSYPFETVFSVVDLHDLAFLMARRGITHHQAVVLYHFSFCRCVLLEAVRAGDEMGRYLLL